MPTFRVINFGCRANQADGAALEHDLATSGFHPSDSERADLVILNSCTVTAGADYSVRQAARQFRRDNPGARIVVTGCYAQRQPLELAALPGVDFVVGNSHKQEIAALIQSQPARDFVPVSNVDSRILHSDIFAHTEFLARPGVAAVFGGTVQERARPNLKIQDGCNNRCSFCVIPYVRGRNRSMPPEEIIRQVRLLCDQGYKEVVFTGINLGRWGRDLNQQGGRVRFAQLILAVLNRTPVERLRLSSVEPMDFTDELLELMASNDRIAKHIHAPLQSGSDRVLRLMRRKYHPRNYRERMERAFALMPNAAFGADVMVGFPGETDADFEETRRFIDSLPFTYLHLFPFSRRPGTPADLMKDQVHGSVVRERGRILRELGAAKNSQFRRRQVGKVMDVVTLNADPQHPGGTLCRSGNFLDVFIAGKRIPGNEMVRVRINSVRGEELVGTMIRGSIGECVDHDISELSVSGEAPSMMTSANA